MTDDETIQELRRRLRELTEENARLAEQVAARDGFLALAAHELRNPMTRSSVASLFCVRPPRRGISHRKSWPTAYSRLIG
jgi:hypothetical protein